MATLVLGAIGTVLGGPLGGALGSLLGSQVDRAIVGNGPDREGPRLTEVSVQTSSYGTGIPKIFGNMRTAGSVIWATDLQETSNRDGGGKGRPSTTTFTYSANLAVALSSRPLKAIGRIWADGNLLRGAQGDFKTETLFRFYSGEEDQALDPLMASHEGIDNSTAHRGISYAVFEDLQLADFGNRIPSLTFEVFDHLGRADIITIANEVSNGLITSDTENFDKITVINGYAVSEGSSREVMDNLLRVLPIELRSKGRVLELLSSSSEAQLLNSPEVLSQNTEDFDRANLVSIAINEIAKEYALRYYDPEREYQAGLQNNSRPGPGRRRVSIDFPAALQAENARELVQQNHVKEIFGVQSLTITVARDWAEYSVGDILILENHAHHWRINEVEEDLGVKSLRLQALPTNSRPLSNLVDMSNNLSGRSVISRDEQVGQTVLHILDLPAFNANNAMRPNIAIAAAGTEIGWRRANLFNRDGANLTAIDTINSMANIGVVANALTPASPFVIDEQNRPVISFVNTSMELSLRSASLRLGSQRYAMIGSEIITFQEAILHEDGTYELRGLGRGIGGTEEYIHTHQAEENFILLDNTQLLFLNDNSHSVGQNLIMEAIGLGDKIPQIAAAQDIGRSLRPLSPVHGGCDMQLDGSLRISWIRRGRVLSHWSDAVDVPLDEDKEQYALIVMAEDQILIDEVIQDNQYIIAGEKIAEWDSENISANIVQIGTYARSKPLIIEHKFLS